MSEMHGLGGKRAVGLAPAPNGQKKGQAFVYSAQCCCFFFPAAQVIPSGVFSAELLLSGPEAAAAEKETFALT